MSVRVTRVAFQGELGAFSHAAARKFFGEEVKTLPCERFDQVFHSVVQGQATHAVIPIENTLHGSVHENYDHLLEYKLTIINETNFRISHQVIGMPGTKLRHVKKVFSHPVALNQCLEFFTDHPEIEPIPFYDTAGSVKMLQAEAPPNSAAIASAAAAEIYGGVILKRGVEDDRQNFTRFFLLAKQRSPRDQAAGPWKTSLVFTTRNNPGALFKAMACFALREINLTKIESRPLRGKPWEYLFYLDLLGHSEEQVVQNAVNNLAEITITLRILGSYKTSP